jgi:hypothetical protein
MVIFCSPQRTASYELPFSVEPLAVVENRFHLKPLLGAVTGLGVFYILSLSKQHVRLLQADRWSVRRVELDESEFAPPSAERDRQKALQVHSGRGGRAVYHGQGQGEHREDEDIRRYLAGVQHALRGRIQPPNALLVLASVDELAAEFRELSGHPNLAADFVSGNVDNLSDHQLHERALPIVELELREQRVRLCQRAKELSRTEQAARDFNEVALAAIDGRIDKLFIRKGAIVWGRLDPTKRRVMRDSEQTPDNEDLLDLIAVQTVDKGGEVFVLDARDMPVAESQLLALLRY